MDFAQLSKERYSVRKFSDKEIGYVSKLMNTGFSDNEPKKVLIGCFETLSREKLLNAKPETDDDWASQLSKIASNKKGSI